MKNKLNFSIVLGAIMALQFGFTQQSFADHANDKNFETKIKSYDHKAYLALEAKEIEVKTMGYDREAYRASLVNVNYWDLKEAKLGLRTKASVACAGTVLADVLVGVLDSIPLANFFLVKGPAEDLVDRDTYREMLAEAQGNNNGSGANPVIATSILLGAGVASIGGPSKAYIGTRVAHEGITRFMGCRQSLLKLDDIEHALNLLRAD